MDEVCRHARLWAGTGASGRPVYEDVPVAELAYGRYRVGGTPALVRGCAAGDVIVLDENSRAEVIERGGNLAIQAFSPTEFSPAEVTRLVEEFTPLGGLVEAPEHRRFVVVTISAGVGFPVIEALITEWSASAGAEWSYGNVFDDDGTPLSWW